MSFSKFYSCKRNRFIVVIERLNVNKENFNHLENIRLLFEKNVSIFEFRLETIINKWQRLFVLWAYVCNFRKKILISILFLKLASSNSESHFVTFFINLAWFDSDVKSDVAIVITTSTCIISSNSDNASFIVVSFKKINIVLSEWSCNAINYQIIRRRKNKFELSNSTCFWQWLFHIKYKHCRLTK